MDTIQQTINNINKLRNLKKGWYEKNTEPPISKILDKTIQFIKAYLKQDDPIPYCIPTPSGGVQLEWHPLGYIIEIEFETDNIGCYKSSKRSDSELNTQYLEEAGLFIRYNLDKNLNWHLIDNNCNIDLTEIDNLFNENSSSK